MPTFLPAADSEADAARVERAESRVLIALTAVLLLLVLGLATMGINLMLLAQRAQEPVLFLPAQGLY